MTTAHSNRTGRGFTLVEVLVVVGVITVLIALLLPALSKARIYAKEVQCMSNLRQCGMAILNYANEAKGFLPYNDGGKTQFNPYSVCTNATGSYQDWSGTWHGLPHCGIFNPNPSQSFSGALNNYIGDFAVWGCPNVGAEPLTNPANSGTYLNSNYAVCWGTAGPSYASPNPRKLAGMPDPSHVVLVQDFTTFQQTGSTIFVRTNHPVGGQSSWCTTYTWDAPGYIDPTNPSDATYFLRVNSTKKQDAIDGINAVFLDFHVEWTSGISTVGVGLDSNGWEWGSGGQRQFMSINRSPR